MFKRPSTHYGKAAEPETPYQRAAQVWDERIGSARVQARNWRYMAFGCLILSAGFAAAINLAPGIKARIAASRITLEITGVRVVRAFVREGSERERFEVANTDALFDLFAKAEAECRNALSAGVPIAAYEQAIEASHVFNLLQARGVISVQERASYMGQVRDMAKGSCEAWIEHNGKEWAEQFPGWSR